MKTTPRTSLSLPTSIAALLAISSSAALFAAEPATPTRSVLTLHADQPGKPISPDLFGIFFEDINYGADGGLYAELIQNRSFEYNPAEQRGWHPLTSWELVTRGGGKGSLAIDTGIPVHPNNPHHVVLDVGAPGEGVGLINAGFDGIAVKAGEAYDASLFARQCYVDGRWGGPKPADPATTTKPLVVRLETKAGEVLAEATIGAPGWEWTRLNATLTPSRSENDARFVVLSHQKGGVALDVISLFPRKTFRERPNGLRADLAQIIADLKPKFIRFPGGCVAHGNGLGNMYRWKDTIGPVEQRREQANLWGYHQTVGLGYFEYFQFCEDIGAKPLPVVAAGVSCQNSGHTAGIGQRCIPLEDMPAYIQEVLDLIEWANGPVTSTWGAKRAAAGHPAPFGLKYLGVGNEDHITPGFRERFQMIHDAVRAKHPEIVVIGTVGPFHAGEDYDAGWKIADELKVAMVDEHYYEKPEWFLNNLQRYDAYDRSRAKVYLGEYAAHDVRRQTTLRSALAEAAYMTGLERNGDVVHLASYAPLLAKVGHTQWNPDLIYFTNTTIHPTINYYVQQLFGVHCGDVYVNSALTPAPAKDAPADFAVSAVRNSQTGALVVKLVNTAATPKALRLAIAGAERLATRATQIVLTGDPMAVNNPDTTSPLVPQTSTVAVGASFDYEAPAHSFTVLRIESR